MLRENLVGTKNRNILAAIAIAGTVAAVTAFASPAAAASSEEVELQAVELMDALTTYAGNDYEIFASLYTDMDTAAIENDFNADWSAYTGKDQHFATLVVAAESYYYVDVTAAICVGTYPDYHSETTDYGFLLVETDDGLKISGSEEGFDQINRLYTDTVFPEGMENAIESGNNATEFDSYIYWFMNENSTVKGSLDCKLKYMWQDENGDLNLAIMIANGTNANRAINEIELSLTDDELGTIWSGNLEGHTMMSGKNQMFVYTIPADEVLTGTQAWSTINYDMNNSNM